MSTPVKVAGFLAALAAVFGIALAAGAAVGPFDDDVTSAHGDDHAAESAHADGDDAAETAAAADVPGGIMVSQDGYSLDLDAVRARPGDDREVSFVISGPDGAPVMDYDVEHEKLLHLIAVRRDLTGFQHVHPELDSDGTWSTELDLTPGDWRVFADFKPTGAEALKLGADLAISGTYRPRPPAAESRTALVDGYEVTLDGDLTAGAEAKLTLSVAKDGEPVTDLQPYLGAYGHLVALRGGDLAYLHVHPEGTPGDGTTEPGPDVVFYAAVPSTGTYHLYLDFQHDGVVRTAAFTVSAEGAEGAENTEDTEDADDPTMPADEGEHSGH